MMLWYEENILMIPFSIPKAKINQICCRRYTVLLNFKDYYFPILANCIRRDWGWFFKYAMSKYAPSYTEIWHSLHNKSQLNVSNSQQVNPTIQLLAFHVSRDNFHISPRKSTGVSKSYQVHYLLNPSVVWFISI
jgi:hypothetical protein